METPSGYVLPAFDVVMISTQHDGEPCVLIRGSSKRMNGLQAKQLLKKLHQRLGAPPQISDAQHEEYERRFEELNEWQREYYRRLVAEMSLAQGRVLDDMAKPPQPRVVQIHPIYNDGTMAFVALDSQGRLWMRAFKDRDNQVDWKEIEGPPLEVQQ